MSTPVTNAAVGGTTSGSSTASTTVNPKASLTASDFLNLMVTQLQNQDPTNPTSSSELLSQMSQIGQLQSATSLQTSLSSFGLQTSVSAASSMIGKEVHGLDSNGGPLSGIVTSVQIQSGNVSMGLDNGSTVALTNISSVAPAPAGSGSSNTAVSGS